MAQVVKHLPGKHKALNSNSSTVSSHFAKKMSSSSVRTTEVPVVYRRMITNSLLMS
jgi:hypothetical protein